MPGLRARKKEQTYQDLLEAARTLILQEGYEKVTVAAVAERAAVCRKTFYNYFPSSDAVIRGLVNVRLERWTRSIRDYSHRKGSAVGKLRQLWRTLGKEIKLEKKIWKNLRNLGIK